MDLAEYKNLTGLTVCTADETRVTANIARSQKILEAMLGFTLTADDVNNNEYTELGKTKTECPNPENIDITDLDDPDSVVYAYRLFPYNHKDQYLSIDPATVINKVKLVVNNVTVKTLVAFDDYRYESKQGLIKFLEKIVNWCSDCCFCNQVQLAVDANWVWPDEIPSDLNYVWADMITWYSDPKNNIKSESLGPHSYSKFNNTPPEKIQANYDIIKKYAGPNGSIKMSITE